MGIYRQRLLWVRSVRCRGGIQAKNVKSYKVGGRPDSPQYYRDERNSGDYGNYYGGSRDRDRYGEAAASEAEPQSFERNATQGFPESVLKALKLIACSFLAVNFQADNSKGHDAAESEWPGTEESDIMLTSFAVVHVFPGFTWEVLSPYVFQADTRGTICL